MIIAGDHPLRGIIMMNFEAVVVVVGLTGEDATKENEISMDGMDHHQIIIIHPHIKMFVERGWGWDHNRRRVVANPYQARALHVRVLAVTTPLMGQSRGDPGVIRRGLLVGARVGATLGQSLAVIRVRRHHRGMVPLRRRVVEVTAVDVPDRNLPTRLRKINVRYLYPNSSCVPTNVILVDTSNARSVQRFVMLFYFAINVPDGTRDVPTSSWVR